MQTTAFPTSQITRGLTGKPFDPTVAMSILRRSYGIPEPGIRPNDTGLYPEYQYVRDVTPEDRERDVIAFSLLQQTFASVRKTALDRLRLAGMEV